MTSDSTDLDPAHVRAIDADASIWMKRGIRLLGDTPPGAVHEALGCFDRALELRRRLPIETAPLLRYGLAACWLNRAEALMRLGEAASIDLALRAFDEALVLLRELPLGADARFPKRLAIAHQNRGLALQARDGTGADAAIAAFADAIAILDREQAALIPERDYLLAAVWMNLANARSAKATAASDSQARAAALRAIALVAHLEAHDADAAEVGLKARHVLCRTLANQLSLNTGSGEAIGDDVHEATDAVDEGLDLVRRWEHQGVARFRGIAHDLFRFGARVYEKFQAQFLDEFILENTDPTRSSPAYVDSAEMRAAAQEVGALRRRAGD
jgi:tetratricopeptide (TPR) repeat protein